MATVTVSSDNELATISAVTKDVQDVLAEFVERLMGDEVAQMGE